MFSMIRPHQWVAVRLPSDNIKVEQMVPNTTISLGKFGSFRTNQIINRPFYITWEILENSDDRQQRELRALKASELYAETLLEEAETDIVGDAAPSPEFDEYGLLNGDKSNVNIFDNPLNQKLTAEEIEALKSDSLFNPRELISKIMASHSSLDQKTAFSLAKYTLRKQKKYMKRFTVLPLDVATMVDWMLSERDAGKIMELRNESIGLIGSWANVHATSIVQNDEDPSAPQDCRYLVVDDTGGLVVAAIAERMGILHHNPAAPKSSATDTDDAVVDQDETIVDAATTQAPKRRRVEEKPLPRSNTIHLIHPKQEPNLSLLKYFDYDPYILSTASDDYPRHPLHSHLKSLTWLQLVDPNADSTYQEPPTRSPDELHNMKTNARSTYYRKRRRWERCKAIVDEARAGGFNGLVIATYTSPLSILHQLVPLLAGGAQIVVYHAHVEPLTEVFDAYSTARRTAFLNLEEHEREEQLGSSKFPVDPTLTLGFSLQTARARKWQVLPGRTHPMMMGRGGAEGYIASATRVLPVKGKIQARGKQTKRAKHNGITVDLDKVDTVEQNNSSGEDEPDTKRTKVDSTLEEASTPIEVDTLMRDP